LATSARVAAPERAAATDASSYAFVMPKRRPRGIWLGCAAFKLREVKMKAPISFKKKITAILIATLGFFAADGLTAELLSLSTDSLVAGLVLSILFFPVIFFAVGAPIYNYFVADHHRQSPSRA
jgi:hypothetical protein